MMNHTACVNDVIKATVFGMQSGVQYISLVIKQSVSLEHDVVFRTPANNYVASHVENIAINLTNRWRCDHAAYVIQRYWRKHQSRMQAYSKLSVYIMHWAWKPRGPLQRLHDTQRCTRWDCLELADV